MGRKSSLQSMALVESQPKLQVPSPNFQHDKFMYYSPNILGMERQLNGQDMRAYCAPDKFSQNAASKELHSPLKDTRVNFYLDKFGQCSPIERYSKECKRSFTKDTNSRDMSSFVSNLHANSKERTKMSNANVIDFSDPHALSRHLEFLDEGEYGSATKEYEAVHSQWMELMNLLTKSFPSISIFGPSSGSLPTALVEAHGPLVGQHAVNPLSSNVQNSLSINRSVIDLDIDYEAVSSGLSSLESMHELSGRSTACLPGSYSPAGYGKVTDITYNLLDLHPKTEGGSDKMSVILLDSDEEDVGDRMGNKQLLNSKPEDVGDQIGNEHAASKPEPGLLVYSRSRTHGVKNSLQKQMRQGSDMPENVLTLANVAMDAHMPCSFPFEKVVLSSVDAQSLNDLVPMIECRSTDSPFQHMKASQGTKRRGRKKKVEDGKELVSGKKRKKKEAEDGKELVSGKRRKKKDVEDGKELISRKRRKKKDKTLNGDMDIQQDTNAELSPVVNLNDILALEYHKKLDIENDDLTDIWKEMTLAMEFSKDAALENPVVEKSELECDHSCFLKDDLGYVCRICGVIQKSIETIFDFQWTKGSKSTRTSMPESGNMGTDQSGVTHFSKLGNLESELLAAEISVHPRHMKQMKPHQLEGFNFLLRNLVTDKPGGCILAHAPGSGKTFMIISFIQSFLAKYPHARPLVVLPKGILSTWKKEFQRWQVENIPLLDFYSVKADNRHQQMEVLEKWVEYKSILFLGYKQFSNIICGSANDKVAATCQEMLLSVPTLLILDEGHTPRNENTDVLHSLAKVKTPRKVVLSGTLFQNHVREVFNILNLVRPKFLKMDSSRSVVRRVLSRVNISGGSRRQCRTGVDTTFFDLVEETLQNDEDFKRKITVIQDLREMTNNVLHYYKGDFLEELPGLLDFTVLLNLTSKQKEAAKRLKQLEKFKRSAVGRAVYMHPNLRNISENAAAERGATFSDEKMEQLLEKIDVKDGVKTKFFLNILGLAESADEKLLVFSQYLLPLKFLERLLINFKGWRPGKEIFMISGDSSAEHREHAMDQFNDSADAKVLFGSIKACGEGISLVGASRILILDVHLNPSVTRQAIGRAFRPGQLKKVFCYRLVAADSAEERDHYTSFRKELISKMWFEWSELYGLREFEMEEINMNDSEDLFLESPLLREDIKVIYKR